jgi:hypothetical protein
LSQPEFTLIGTLLCLWRHECWFWAYKEVSRVDPGRLGVVEMLTYHWHLKDVSRPFSRAACAVLYVIGFGFLFIPTALTFAGVVRYTMTLLWTTAP